MKVIGVLTPQSNQRGIETRSDKSDDPRRRSASIEPAWD